MKRIYNIITSMLLLVILGIVSASNIYALAPTTQARNLTFSNVTASGAKISWLNGNGTGRLVVVFPNTIAVGDIDAAVSNGTIYTGSTTYGNGSSQIGSSGAYAVYRGTGSTRNVTIASGLSASTTYNVKVYEYLNDGGVDPEYLKSSGTNNPRTFTTENAPVSPPVLSAADEITDNSFVINYTDASSIDGYYLDVAEDVTGAMDPRLPDYDYVDIGKPNPAEFEVGGLDAATDYEYRMFSYKGVDVSVASTIGTATTTADATPPTVISAERVNNTTIKLFFSEDIVEHSASESDFDVNFTKSNDDPSVTTISTVVVSGNELTITIGGDNLSTIKNGENVTISYTDINESIRDVNNLNAVDFSATIYDWTAPAVTSIERTTPSGQYTNADEVTFTVNFDESVTGIAIADFETSEFQSLYSSTIVSVSASSGTSVTVVVNDFDNGNGDLRLDFVGQVYDVAGNISSETDFTGGEVYTIDNTAPTTNLASVTAVAIGANDLDGAGRTTLLDAGDNNTNLEYYNISDRIAGDLSYIRVYVDNTVGTDASLLNGFFKIEYSTDNFATAGTTLKLANTNDRSFEITDHTAASYDITVAATDNLGAALLAEDDANGVTYSFRVTYTDRAGNAQDGTNSTSGETITKDIVAPVFSSYVVGGTLLDQEPATSNTAGASGKFFDNGDDYYYNSTTNSINVAVILQNAKPTMINATLNVIAEYWDGGSFEPITNATYSISTDTDELDEVTNGVVINGNDFEDDVEAMNMGAGIGNADVRFRVSAIDLAGNPNTPVYSLENVFGTPTFTFNYDVTAPTLSTATFSTTSGYININNQLDFVLTFAGDETGAEFLMDEFSHINNVDAETLSVEETFDASVGNNQGTLGYLVDQGNDFILDEQEIPFNIRARDIAGNIFTISDATPYEGNGGDWEVEQPGIDATIPEYTAGSITLTPETNSNVATVGVFGDINGDAIINLATTRIQTVIACTTATTNMNGGILRVYPSYNSETGYNGYFEYNVSTNTTFDINVLMSDLTGAQDGEEGGTDWDWNETANGDAQIFFKFKFVSVGGNVGDFFPEDAQGGFVVDVVRPEVISINRSNPLGQYTNANNVEFAASFSEQIFDESVDAEEDFELDATGDVTATIWTIAPWGTSTTLDVYILNIAGDGDLRLDFLGTVTDAAGNNNEDEFTTGAIYTIDNLAPESVELTATANGDSYAEYYNADADQITLTGTMPNDPSLNGGSYDIQYKIGAGDWTTFEDYNDVAIAALDLGEPINIPISEAELNEENPNIIADGASRILRMVMIDRASNSTNSSEESIIFDLTPPELLTINRDFPMEEETNETLVTFKATFSEDVTGLTDTDFLANVLTGDLSVNINDFDDNGDNAFIVVQADGTGELRLDFDGGIVDLAGNSVGLDQNGDETYIIDNVAPIISTITRTGGADYLTNATTVSYTVNFSECVTDVASEDFAVGTAGTIESVTMSNCSTYVVVCSTAVDTYLSTLEATGTITDEFGNELVVPTTGTTNESYDVDRVAPTVVSVTPSVTNITDATSATFTIEVLFNESMDPDFDPTITFSPTVSSTLDFVEGEWSTDDDPNNTYTATYTKSDANISIEDIDVIVSGGQDVVGYIMEESLNEDEFSIATNNAVVTSITTNIIAGDDELISEEDAVVFNFTVTVVFDRSMNDAFAPTIGFSPALLTTLTNATGEWSQTNVPNDTYTMAYDIVDNDAYATIVDIDVTDAEDLSGNPMSPLDDQGDNKFSVDMVKPEVTIVRAIGSTNPTNATSVDFTVTFSEAVTGVEAEDFEKIGTANGTVNSVTAVSSTEYTVNVNLVSGNGDLRIGLNNESTFDLAGNTNEGYGGGDEYTIDNTAPTAVASPTFLATGGNVVPNYYNLSNTGVSVAFTVPNEVGGKYTLQVWDQDAMLGGGEWDDVTDNMDVFIIPVDSENGGANANEATESATLLIADDNVAIAAAIAANNGSQLKFRVQAYDAAGNSTDGIESNSRTIDETAPTVTTIARTTPVGQNTNATSVTFTVTFNESVDGLTTDNFSISGDGSTNASISGLAGSDDEYTVTVSGIDTDGTLTLALDNSTDLSDVAGNAVTNFVAGSSESYTIDNSDPTIVVTTPGGCVNTTNAFNITVTTDANSDYANDATKYSGSIGGEALTINSVTPVSTTNKTLNVSLANAPGATGFYDLSITVTDLAGNTGTDTQTGGDQIKFSTGVDPTAKIVASGADAEYDPNLAVAFGSISTLSTISVCDVTGSDVVFKYVVSADEDDAETVAVKITRGGNTTTLDTPADYSVNTTTNTITILNASIADGDVITVELTGTFTCAAVVSGNLTVTVNPLPTAATFTRTGTSGTVCYNDNSGVILTIDQAVADKSAFSNYTYEISSNGGAYVALPNATRFAVSGTNNSILTITNVGTDFPTCSTFTIRATKTIAATGCTITSESDPILVNREMNAVAGYGGPSTTPRNTTNSYTFTAPTIGTPTSYEWRVVNGSNVVETNVTVTNPTTTAPSITNSIYFNNSIAFGTYYIQVRPINSCQTAPAWPGNGEGRAVTVERTASTISGTGGSKNITLTVNYGNYDGAIVLMRQTNGNLLTGDLNNTNLTGIIGSGATTNPTMATWGTSESDAITFGGGAVLDVNYVIDEAIQNNTVSYPFTSGVLPGTTIATRRYVFRVVDFTNGSPATKANRSYRLDNASTGNAVRGPKISTENDLDFEESGNTISAISPNPAKDFIAFDMNLVESANVTIAIYTMEGREVLRFADGQMFGAGLHNINIPLKDFITGAYGISISFGGEAIFETFMVTP